MHTCTILSARSRAQLVASAVGVRLGPDRTLSGVDLTVGPGSRWAIVGENGTGKTSLLDVLSGARRPDSGTVTRTGTLGFAPQEMPAATGRTVGDVVAAAIADALTSLTDLERAAAAVAQGDAGADEDYACALDAAVALDAWDAERRVRVALEALGAGSDWTRPLADLSVGQRYRVRLACLLGADHDFLLLDEPTNHLDRAGLDFLTAQLRVRPGGVVLVTHDRALLADLAENILDLDPTPDGRPRTFGGGYAGYRDGRHAERQHWLQDYERQQAEGARLQEDLIAAQSRLVDRWRPEKGAGKHQRATRAAGSVQSVHRRQAELTAHALSMPERPPVFTFPELPIRSGAALLSAEDVVVPSRLRTPVSLTLHGGARVVVTGPNGSGKSTLLAVLAGELDPGEGCVRRADRIRVALLRQESSLPTHVRVGELYETRLDTLRLSDAAAQPGPVPLSSLGLFRAREAGLRVGELSTGQLRRLDLALALAARPHLLLLDEPTNHLSVALVDDLTEALTGTSAAVVLASHDRQLLREVEGWDRVELAGDGGADTPVR
jgi:macrolide transport system ATP-binding/permease protein